MKLGRRLLWIDCTAGFLAGVTLIALAAWLSRWYALPRPLLLGMGAANLAYATFSYSLARRPRRPPRLIAGLVAANALWSGLCVVLAARFAGTATGFGLASLMLEGLFVGGLAVLEWTFRDQLIVAA